MASVLSQLLTLVKGASTNLGQLLVSQGYGRVTLAPFIVDVPITNDGTITVPHNLGYEPNFVQIKLICTTTGAVGYVPGDHVVIAPGSQPYGVGNFTGSGTGVVILTTPTQFFITYGDAAANSATNTSFMLMQKTTYIWQLIVNSSFLMRITAY